MHWIIIGKGEMVNLAFADYIRVRSSDSKSGKHEVVAHMQNGIVVIFKHMELERCTQFVTDLYANLQLRPVLDRAPEPKE